MFRLSSIGWSGAAGAQQATFLLVLALLSASACDTTPAKMNGKSMEPTLTDGENMFVTRTVGALRRGDIVTLYYPRDQSKSFVERMIGLPGERLEMGQRACQDRRNGDRRGLHCSGPPFVGNGLAGHDSRG